MKPIKAAIIPIVVSSLAAPVFAQELEGAFISGTGAIVFDGDGGETGEFNVDGGLDFSINSLFGIETQANVETDEDFEDYTFGGAIIPYLNFGTDHKIGASANLAVADDGDTEDFYGLHWLFNEENSGYRGELGLNYASISNDDIYQIAYTAEKPIRHDLSILGRASYLFVDGDDTDQLVVGPGLSYEFSPGADVFGYADYINEDGDDQARLTLGLRLHLKGGRRTFRDTVGIPQLQSFK